MPTVFCQVRNLNQKKPARVQGSQEDTGGNGSSEHGSEWPTNFSHVPHEVQILQQILPQRPHSQVPHVQHPQGAKQQRGLEVPILWAGDRTKQVNDDDDLEAHEERPPHRLLHDKQGSLLVDCPADCPA